MKSLFLLKWKLGIQFLLYMYIFGHAPNIVRICLWHKEYLTTKLFGTSKFRLSTFVLKGGFVRPKNNRIVWNNKIPCRIKNFLWLIWKRCHRSHRYIIWSKKLAGQSNLLLLWSKWINLSSFFNCVIARVIWFCSSILLWLEMQWEPDPRFLHGIPLFGDEDWNRQKICPRSPRTCPVNSLLLQISPLTYSNPIKT